MGDFSSVGPLGMAGPAVIADAYDLYADQLYAYCRFFAPDPVDAAGALGNVFLVAAGRGAALPLDGQLRSWLFAVARNECLRGVRSRRPVPGPDGPGEGRAGRETLAVAASGLGSADRDLVAMLWHGLDADDIAAVLGISREESFARLEAAIGRLRTAAGDEPRALRLSLTPAALLGAGVSAEALRPAAAAVAELRDHVLNVACDPSGEGGEARRRACGLAGPFGLSSQADGGDFSPFPVPLPADPVRGVPRSRLTVALTGAAAAVLAVAAGFAVTGGPGPVPRSATASAGLSPTLGVPPDVTLRWNPRRGELEGLLTVTVKGGPLAWSVSDPDRGLRLSRDSGTVSASVAVTSRARGGLRPLFVTAGNVTYTVTLTTVG